MRFFVSDLPPIHRDDSDVIPVSPDLPAFPTVFNVPRLADKPQNPILDALTVAARISAKNAPPKTQRRPQPAPLALAPLVIESAPETLEGVELWEGVGRRVGAEAEGVCYSWDSLHPGCVSEPYMTPYLSEQSSIVFAPDIARPRLSDLLKEDTATLEESKDVQATFQIH